MTIDKIEMSGGFVNVPTPNFEPSERWRIMKNILVISCAFMVNFTAFMGASNLQSSVNADQSLGTFTLSAIYGSLLFSNILLPALIISWLGCKWTMSVSILAYMPFIASQFYPKFYTMIPAGLSVGLGGGPLWCAKCTYLTVVAEAYSTVSDIAVDVLVTRFFGLFFMFYQMAQVWGNLISSAVQDKIINDYEITNRNEVRQKNFAVRAIFTEVCMNRCQAIKTRAPMKTKLSFYCRESRDYETTNTNCAITEVWSGILIAIFYVNETYILVCLLNRKIIVLSYGIDTAITNVTLNSSIVAEICGANFCGVSKENENPNLQPPPVERIHLISGIYLGCMILACLIIAFTVDPLSRYDRNRARLVKGSSGFKLLAVTLKLLKEKNQLLILPITLFIGAEQAFLFADYNASFVSCAWGINNIGYVMICFGITNAIAALSTGAIVKLTGRKPVMIFAFCLHLSLFVYMLQWKPTPEQGIMFFLLSGLWGVCDSIWLVQVNALSGILFPGREEAAFANFRLWESTGSVMTYVYSPYLCTCTKLYLLIGILCVGMVGYSIIEWLGIRADKAVSDNNKPDLELMNDRNINR